VQSTNILVKKGYTNTLDTISSPLATVNILIKSSPLMQ